MAIVVGGKWSTIPWNLRTRANRQPGSTVEDDHSGVRGLVFGNLRPSTMITLQKVFNTKRVAQSITWTVRTVSQIAY